MLKNKPIKEVDIAILGAGPAGISAGIYAAQDKSNFLLIEKNEPCWFLKEAINSHYFVDGFTGVKAKTTGTKLKKDFLEHYLRLGGDILQEDIEILSKQKNRFFIRTNKKNIYSKTVILASGTKPERLNIKNEDSFKKNIHYYCTIDGKKYEGKKVLVVGGRNSGAVAACYLSDLGCKVTLVERKKEIQAKEKYKKRLVEKRVNIITGAEIHNLDGYKELEKVEIKKRDKEKYYLEVKSIFVYIGRSPNLDFVDIPLEKDDLGYLLVDCFNKTSVDGLFAAGDITCKLKQAITACGDGANAYYFAHKFIG